MRAEQRLGLCWWSVRFLLEAIRIQRGSATLVRTQGLSGTANSTVTSGGGGPGHGGVSCASSGGVGALIEETQLNRGPCSL